MRTELLGRETEMAALERCLTDAMKGRAQLVLCQGEAGIGKTRLADELLALAAVEGVLGVWGLAADSSSAPPYWPWWQVFRAISNTVDVATMSRERGLDLDLARLAPDVFGSDSVPLEATGSADDRFRQFDAVARLLRQVCLQTPLVIVLDDVHWVDKASLLLLQHVTRSVTDERLLLVANSRVTEARHGELLAGLLREPRTTAIHLGGLGAPAIRRQLASVVGRAFEAGDLGRVAIEVDALTRCAQEVRGPLARFEVLRCRAVLAYAQGRFADARRLAQDAFTVLVPTGYTVGFHLRAALLPFIGRHAGQDEASLTANDYVDAPDLRGAPGLISGVAHAVTSVSVGRLDEAADMYRSLGPVTVWRPPAHVVLLSYAMGIAVAVALEASDDVAVLVDRLAPYRGHHAVSGIGAMSYFGPVELWLGVGAHHLGRLDDAVSDLERAESACVASGAHGFRVEAQYELATVLAHRAGPGDLQRDRSLLAVAAKTAGTLGMVPFVERITALRRRLDDAPHATALTRREREVAELVAEGLTNRELAERLFLSERTAQTHVQHILTKLGLPNRGQIAVWVTTRR